MIHERIIPANHAKNLKGIKEMNHANSFHTFVANKHHDNITADLDKQFSIKMEGEAKPVTVRLDPSAIKTIDSISDYLGVSRQKFLAELVDGGIGTALHSIADTEGHLRAERTGKTDKEMQEFIEEIRLNLIRELVA